MHENQSLAVGYHGLETMLHPLQIFRQLQELPPWLDRSLSSGSLRNPEEIEIF